ncbi:VWA domain-containing protein [Bacteroidota bacterium]
MFSALLFSGFKAKSLELPEKETGVPIDVVFVIDISGSTGGLLASVRAKFWELQDEMARLEPEANYRLGIVCTGRPSFKKENNYIKLVSDLTEDIDAAAQAFFKIKDVTAPGNYFLGHALDVAINEISWSKDPDAIKLVFLAGNGQPSAGPGFKKPLRKAIEEGIVIHALYFQTYSNAKEQMDWKRIALNSGGKFIPIETLEPDAILNRTYDGSLIREANDLLSQTYLYYGPYGKFHRDVQIELDEEAELMGNDQVESRAFFKASRLYQGKNAKWDLVDLMKRDNQQILRKNRKRMDPALVEMSDAELVERVMEASGERDEYISIVGITSTQREDFYRRKRQKMKGYNRNKTFYTVASRRIVEAAEKKGYHLIY